MTQAQIYQHFKDHGIRPGEIAKATGLSYSYVVELLRGTESLSDSARFKLISAYPDTAVFLLPGGDKPEETEER